MFIRAEKESSDFVLESYFEEMSKPLKIEAETPEQFENLTVDKFAEKAAGLKAALLTTQNSITKMGLLKAAKGLLRINQFDGFDCQSCAWGDDVEHRKLAEF